MNLMKKIAQPIFLNQLIKTRLQNQNLNRNQRRQFNKPTKKKEEMTNKENIMK